MTKREARYISELANLVESVEKLGIPADYMKKRYLSDIDWAEIEKYKNSTEINKKMGTKDDGMGGGF